MGNLDPNSEEYKAAKKLYEAYIKNILDERLKPSTVSAAVTEDLPGPASADIVPRTFPPSQRTGQRPRDGGAAAEDVVSDVH